MNRDKSHETATAQNVPSVLNIKTKSLLRESCGVSKAIG